MNKIFYIILISLFSLSIISCSSKDDNEKFNEPVRKGGDTVNDVLDPVGDGINDGLDPVGDTVNDVLDPVGDTVNDGLDSVGDGVGTITGGTGGAGGGSSTTTDNTTTTGCTTNSSWTKQLGSSESEYAYSVTTDSSCNIYVTGITEGDLDGNTNSGGDCSWQFDYLFGIKSLCSDIFLVKYNSSGTKQWTKPLGISKNDVAKSVTTDLSGNIYITGFTSGDLDGNTNSGGSDIFLVKYNSSGTKQWSKQLGAKGADIGYSVITDSSGNIYVSGHTASNPGLDGKYYDGMKFGGYYSRDLFLVKYTSSGTKKWLKQLKNCCTDRDGVITIDSSGNIYMGATTEGGLNGCTYGRSDIVLTKFNSSGKRKWINAFNMCGTSVSALQLGSSELEGGRGIATDSLGYIYMTGFTQGNLGWWEKNKGRADIFLTKINSSGKVKWIRQLGSSENEDAYGVTIDSSDNIYVTGNTQGDLDGNTNLGGECEVGRGKIQLCNDIFLVKYNSSGTKQWTKLLGTSKNDFATSITTDSSDNIYVTGYTNGDLDGNTNSGKDDIFLVKFNSDGVKQ